MKKKDHRVKGCNHGPKDICDYCLIAEGKRLGLLPRKGKK